MPDRLDSVHKKLDVSFMKVLWIYLNILVCYNLWIVVDAAMRSLTLPNMFSRIPPDRSDEVVKLIIIYSLLFSSCFHNSLNRQKPFQSGNVTQVPVSTFEEWYLSLKWRWKQVDTQMADTSYSILLFLKNE